MEAPCVYKLFTNCLGIGGHTSEEINSSSCLYKIEKRFATSESFTLCARTSVSEWNTSNLSIPWLSLRFTGRYKLVYSMKLRESSIQVMPRFCCCPHLGEWAIWPHPSSAACIWQGCGPKHSLASYMHGYQLPFPRTANSVSCKAFFHCSSGGFW